MQPLPAELNLTVAPPSETLLFIRTTERTGPNSWMWTVTVWQVIWTTPVENSAEKAPIAHKT
jgi:hypothetical protein